MPDTGPLLMRRGFAQKCRYCGAGPDTKPEPNKHDKYCLRNVPAEGAKFWHRGYKDQLAGKVRTVAPGEPFLYMMGVACAAKFQIRRTPA